MALYPPIEPYNTGFLPVSAIHTLYYEQCGNAKGTPILFVHGGPGGGCSASDRCFFDPSFYRVILFDQRGAGRSTPTACLDDNDTWALVADIEALRTHLGIEHWHVFGGSWGSTLSLVYAESHPSRVDSLTLRGIFTLRQEELRWFYQEGASNIFPDAFDDYLAPIPEAERGDLIAAYHKRLTGSDEAAKIECAQAWTKWEMTTSKLFVDPATVARGEDPKFALAFARIEAHYFANKGFFPEDGFVINNVHKIHHIPTTIAQGRYDLVCPMKTAYDLLKAFPQAKLIAVPDAGHSAREAGITHALVAALDAIRNKVRGVQQVTAPPAGMPASAQLHPSQRFNESVARHKAGPEKLVFTTTEVPETRYFESNPPKKALAGTTITFHPSHEIPQVRFHSADAPHKALAGTEVKPTEIQPNPHNRFFESNTGKRTVGNITTPTPDYENPLNRFVDGHHRKGVAGAITQPTATYENPLNRFVDGHHRKGVAGAITQPTASYENPLDRFNVDHNRKGTAGAIVQPTAAYENPRDRFSVEHNRKGTAGNITTPTATSENLSARFDGEPRRHKAAADDAGIPSRKSLAPPGGLSSVIFG